MGLAPSRDLLLQLLSTCTYDIVCLVETHMVELDVEAARIIKQFGYVKV